jgi:hypothetical protein
MKKRLKEASLREQAKSKEKREAWFRIVVFIVTGFILQLWKCLVYVLIVVNWLIAIFSGKRDKSIAEFCEYWNTELYKFAHYMTFLSNVRPFPFSNMERLNLFEK